MIVDTPCEARVRVVRSDGTDRCSRMAAHEHYLFATGIRLLLCTQHRDCLIRRERLGSAGEFVTGWGE